MILTGPQIKAEIAAQRIRIDPFHPERVTTDSYDLELGGEVIRYLDPVLDARTPPRHETITIPPEGMLLNAGDFVIGHSAESVGSDHFAALIHAKTSIARLGLFIHITSDLIHTGSYGHIAFQLFATLPVTIRAGMLIGQVTFWVPKGEISLYRGKYHGAQGPMASVAHKDFKDA
jgi:dCTP deaminase